MTRLHGVSAIMLLLGSSLLIGDERKQPPAAVSLPDSPVGRIGRSLLQVLESTDVSLPLRPQSVISNPSLPFVGWMLLAHAFLPEAPYGSWMARGRPDPGGKWEMPPAIFAVAWIVMALGYTFSGYTKLVSPSWVDVRRSAGSWTTRWHVRASFEI
jgi:hypothetical protein